MHYQVESLRRLLGGTSVIIYPTFMSQAQSEKYVLVITMQDFECYTLKKIIFTIHLGD